MKNIFADILHGLFSALYKWWKKDEILTKQQRHFVYCECLKEVERMKIFDVPIYLCWIIQGLIKKMNLHDDYFFIKVKDFVPELYKCRKKDIIWFENNEQRIIALKKCIELTKD